MGDLNKIKDENVRRLAETLRSSGLAASDSEAVRMAENMSHTGGKVSQNFEQKREKSIMGLSHLNKNVKQEPVVEKGDCNCDPGCECKEGECDCAHEVLPQDEIVNQTDADESFSEEPKIEEMTVNEAAGLEDSNDDSYMMEEPVRAEEAQPGFEEKPMAEEVPQEELEVPPPPEFEEPGTVPVQDGAMEAPEPEPSEVEEPKEEPETLVEPEKKPEEEKKEEKPAPKRDLNSFKEAKVDLGAVFKYKG